MIGHGITLSGATVGTIGKITNLDWSGLVAEDVEKTDFDSEDKYKEYEPGLKEPGEITGDLKYDKTLANTVLNAIHGDAAGAASDELWTLTLATGAQIWCRGYLKSLAMAMPIGNQVMMPIAIKLTGKVSFPSSSSSSSSSS